MAQIGKPIRRIKTQPEPEPVREPVREPEREKEKEPVRTMRDMRDRERGMRRQVAFAVCSYLAGVVSAVGATLFFQSGNRLGWLYAGCALLWAVSLGAVVRTTWWQARAKAYRDQDNRFWHDHPGYSRLADPRNREYMERSGHADLG